jgi:hypothetical protein
VLIKIKKMSQGNAEATQPVSLKRARLDDDAAEPIHTQDASATPPPPLKRARTEPVRYLYIPFGNTMTADGTFHGLCVHTCSDAARARAVFQAVYDFYGEHDNDNATYALLMAMMHRSVNGGKPFAGEDDICKAALDRIAPTPPGVTEHWEESMDTIMVDINGPFEKIMTYFLDVGKLF